MASIGELFVELGVFADTKELEQFNNKLKKVNTNIKILRRELKVVSIAVSTAFYAINKLTNSLIASNQEFLNLTRNTDIALSTFQKWNNVGRMFGVKNAAQQIANLNQRLFELKLTGQGAEGFILAGINPLGQDAEGVMEQLRNRVAGLDDTAATFLLNRMGLDPSMLHLLRMTRQEFEELGRTVEKYQLTQEQRAQIQVFNKQLEIARIKLEYLKDRVVLKLLPIFVQFMHSLYGVSKVLKDIVKAIEKIPALKNTLIGIGAAIMIWFHPILALFSALYLIIDDVAHYINGGGSMIGVFMKALEEFHEKGFFSDNVPQWIQVLAEAADKLLKWWEGQKEQAADKLLKWWEGQKEQAARKEFNSPYIQAVKNADGSYGYAEVIPEAYKRPYLNGINQSLDNSTNYNNQSMTVHMANTFNSQQPARDTYDQLFYLRNAFAPNQ